MNFFSNIITSIENVLTVFYTTNVAKIMVYIAPLIGTCALILVIGIGISLLFGWSQDKTKSMLMACVTIVFVSIIAGSVAQYNIFFADWLRGLPDDLMNLFLGGGSSNAGEALDAFGTNVITGIVSVWENASGISENIAAVMFGLLLFVMWIAMSVAALFVLLTIKIVLTILITLGPLFILFIIFPQTKEYFSKWLTYALSFGFLAVIIGGILAIVSAVATEYFVKFQDEAQDISFLVYAAPALVLVSLFKLFEQAPSLASSVTGGIGLSVGNAAGAIASKVASPAISGAKKLGAKATGKVTGKAGRDLKKQFKQEDNVRDARTQYNLQKEAKEAKKEQKQQKKQLS